MLRRFVAIAAMVAILACTVAVDLAYVAEAFLTSGPPEEIIEKILGRSIDPETLAREALGRDVRLGRVEVPGLREVRSVSDALHLKSVEVYELRIPSDRSGPEAAPDLVSVGKVELRLDRFALLEQRVELLEVVLEGLRVDLFPGPDGELELVRLVKGLQARMPPSAGPPPRLPSVTIRDGWTRFALDAVFRPGHVQEVRDLDLVFRPLGPERFLVQATFDLGLLGRGSLHAEYDGARGQVQAHVSLPGLRLSPDLAAILSPAVLSNWKNYSPNGVADLAADVTVTQVEETDAAGATRKVWKPRFLARLDMRGLEMTYVNFAYPVLVESGTAELREDGFRLIRLSGKSTKSSTRVLIDGEADGYERQDALHLRISLDDVELDRHIRAALAEDDQQSFDLFAPSGRVRAYCDVRKESGEGKRAINHMRLTCEDVSLTFRNFPYRLTGVTGDIEFLETEIRAKNVTGYHGGTRFRILGAITSLGQGAGFDMSIEATDVVLDEELRAAFEPEMREVWDLFSPSGTADVRWRTVRGSGDGAPVQHYIRARCLDVAASYVETPYPVQHIVGDIEYEPGRVRLRHLSGRDGDAQVYLNGYVHLSEPAPVLQLEVRGREVQINEKLLRAVPPGLRTVIEEIGGAGVVDFTANVERKPAPAGAFGAGPPSGGAVEPGGRRRVPTQTDYTADVRLDDCAFQMGGVFEHVHGQLGAQGSLLDSSNKVLGWITFDQARVEGKRVTDAKCKFSFSDGQLSLQDLTATAYSGLITGAMKIATANKDFHAELNVNGLDLRTFTRDTFISGRDVSGRLNGDLLLSGRGLDKKAMVGRGEIRIQDGALWDVPIFFSLLQDLSLSQQKQFQTGNVEFVLRNGIARIDKLDFRGEDITVTGAGEMDLNGNIHLMLDAAFPVALIPSIPIIADAWELLRKGIYAVEMTGTFKDPQVGLRPLPILGNTGRRMMGMKDREEEPAPGRKDPERTDGRNRRDDRR